MLVMLVAEDGTFIDEGNLESMPSVGDKITVGRDYEVLETPDQDDNAKKLKAHVLVVRQV